MDPEPARVAEGVRAEYDRLREAHYLAADHLKMLDRERETVLLEYHSTFNQMIETSVRLQRLLHNDGSQVSENLRDEGRTDAR